MRFLRPDLMHWWLVIPVIIAVWAVQFQYRRVVRRHTQVARRFAALSQRTTWARDVAVLVACLTTASALIFSLMRPQMILSRRTPEFQRADLIVILDRSASMRAEDIEPSRLVRAASEIKKFLQNKPDTIDRIGLVGFANESVIYSYLTRDLSSIFFYLDWNGDDPDTLFGTNIGAALKNAMKIAEQDDHESKKIFLLLSDGEDHSDELETALTLFRAKGYQIQCVGIGSENEVPIPFPDSESNGIYLTDTNGQLVKTKFQESTLMAIAETTGGRYVRSTTGGEMAKNIAFSVGNSRRVVNWKTSTESRDIYPAGLALAGIAASLLWILL